MKVGVIFNHQASAYGLTYLKGEYAELNESLAETLLARGTARRANGQPHKPAAKRTAEVILEQGVTLDGRHHRRGARIRLPEHGAAALCGAGIAARMDGKPASDRLVDQAGHPVRAFNVGPRPVAPPK